MSEGKVKKALVGIHDDMVAGMYKMIFERSGYHVDVCSKKADMIRHLGSTVYDWCVMDINLEFPRQINNEPAKAIFSILPPATKSNFISTSSMLELVDMTKTQGIPAMFKSDVVKYLREALAKE